MKSSANLDNVIKMNNEAQENDDLVFYIPFNII